MASAWGYRETNEDLNYRFLFTSSELESLKEDMRRNEEKVKQLIQLQKITIQERDEARDQLQILLNQIKLSNTVEHCPIASNLQTESPQMRQTKGKSSIAESDSLYETHNHSSYICSSIESLNTANSPELSNFNMADSCNIVVPQQPLFPEPEYNTNSSTSVVGITSGIANYDQAYARIDALVMKKPLPEKGKLFQAVMEAGPLLQNILMTGPLPQWRNPPQLQPLQIPPDSVKGGNSQTLNQIATMNPNPLVQSSLNGLHHENSLGESQMHTIMSGLCVMKKPMASPCISSYQGLSAK